MAYMILAMNGEPIEMGWIDEAKILQRQSIWKTLKEAEEALHLLKNHAIDGDLDVTKNTMKIVEVIDK